MLARWKLGVRFGSDIFGLRGCYYRIGFVGMRSLVEIFEGRDVVRWSAYVPVYKLY